MKVDLKPDERKAYEELLQTNDINKALKKLTAGTPSYKALNYLNKMKSQESFAKLSEGEWNEIQDFVEDLDRNSSTQVKRLSTRF